MNKFASLAEERAEMLKAMKEIAGKTIIEGNGVPPIMSASINGTWLMVAVAEPKGKDMGDVFAAMTYDLKEKGAHLCVAAAECWTLEVPVEDAEEVESGKVRPSQHKNRKECVMLSVSDVETDQCWIADMNRDEHGVVTLGEWRDMTGDQISGRMCGIMNGTSTYIPETGGDMQLIHINENHDITDQDRDIAEMFGMTESLEEIEHGVRDGWDWDDEIPPGRM